jgi:phage shock protein PspC (stress-responsive transcriptional regulator)
LQAVDNEKNFGAIIAGLAEAYNAPVDLIAKDAATFLTGLVERRVVELK